MQLFRGSNREAHVERRVAARFRVDCPAKLVMPSGDRSGRMADLSEGGACLHLSDPPRAGMTVLLQWGTYEFFCNVVWIKEDACGLSFEKPIPLAVVRETTGRIDEPAGQAADFGRIPLGNKRSARLRSF